MQLTKTLLLIVDPQNDFCDLEGVLFIPGANKDMERLASMIQKHSDKIDRIEITLDSHHWVHIAHPYFWTDAEGNPPPFFTTIHLKDVEGSAPFWKARFPLYVDYAINYVAQLSSKKKYELIIWPPHCIIGTWGHNVFPILMEALHHYEERFAKVHYNFKGGNSLTEHYSGIKAEIVDPLDASTDVNQDLLKRIADADRVIIAGEALSHCVANTVNDILKYLGKEQAAKLVILEDACSNIAGFESYGRQFLDEMRSLNVKIEKTTSCFE